MKHRSQEGPGTISDGLLIGAGVGVGTTFLPPLTSLIATNHPEEAKLLIILSWSAGIVFGGLIGGTLASIGRKYLDHASVAMEESQR
jgi:MFS family permease